MKTKSIVLCLIAAFCLLCPAVSFSQEVAETVVATDSTVASEIAQVETVNNGKFVKELILSILFVILSVAMVAHMIYVRFIKKPLPENYTPDYFKEQRSTGEYVSEAEAAERSDAILSGIYDSWTPIESGSDIRVPFTRKAVMNAYAGVDEVVRLAPTDSEVVGRLNEVNHSLNECMKRSFGGSKTFLIVSWIIGVLLSFASGTWNFMGMLAVSSFVYWLASQTPVWMQVRTEMKGNGGKPSFMTRLFGGLFGAAATAETYKVITTYSDGSKTEETDNSNFWLTLIFSIIIMVVLAVCMFFVAAISYLRNYVIYR